MASYHGVYFQMLDDCEEHESRLTEWERTFIDSIRTQLENEYDLTQKQLEVLDNTWNRATRND